MVISDILRGVLKFAGENAVIGLCTILIVDKYNTTKNDIESTKFSVNTQAVEMAKVQTALSGVKEEIKEFKQLFFHKQAMKGE